MGNDSRACRSYQSRGCALPGAQDAFSTPNVRVRYRVPSKSYGPNGAYIDTGDTRHRNIHGGGSCSIATLVILKRFDKAGV